MLRKFQGEPLKPDHVLVFCQASFLMTLSRVGFLTLAPGMLICPLPGDLPDPRIKPTSPALAGTSLPLSHQGSPVGLCSCCLNFLPSSFLFNLPGEIKKKRDFFIESFSSDADIAQQFTAGNLFFFAEVSERKAYSSLSSALLLSVEEMATYFQSSLSFQRSASLQSLL